MTRSVNDWDVEELMHWLRLYLNPAEYREVARPLRTNEVDGKTFLGLTTREMKDELDITALWVRKRLAMAVERLQKGLCTEHLQLAARLELADVAEHEVLAATAAEESALPAAALEAHEAEVRVLSRRVQDAAYAELIEEVGLQQRQRTEADFEIAAKLQGTFDCLQQQEAADADFEIAAKLQGTFDGLQQQEAADAQMARAVHEAQGAGEAAVRKVLSAGLAPAAASPGTARVDEPEAQGAGDAAVQKVPSAGLAPAAASLGTARADEPEAQGADEAAVQKVPSVGLAPAAASPGTARVDEPEAGPTPSPASADAAAGGCAAAEADAMRECASCRQDKPEGTVFEMRCGHAYCEPCLHQYIVAMSVKDSKLPPHCCLQAMDMDIVKSVLGPQVFMDLEQRWHESRISNVMYCSSRACQHAIDMDKVGTGVFPCPRCSTALCSVCRSFAHPLMTCEEYMAQADGDDWELASVLFLSVAKRWKRCGNCANLIELSTGCNHMRCTCGYQFCYVCGSKWRTCKCSFADLERVLEPATDIDDAPPPPRRSPQPLPGAGAGSSSSFAPPPRENRLLVGAWVDGNGKFVYEVVETSSSEYEIRRTNSGGHVVFGSSALRAVGGGVFEGSLNHVDIRLHAEQQGSTDALVLERLRPRWGWPGIERLFRFRMGAGTPHPQEAEGATPSGSTSKQIAQMLEMHRGTPHEARVRDFLRGLGSRP